MTDNELTLQGRTYEHIGDGGIHRGHHLVADEMGDVWCQTCRSWLDDEEEGLAWPGDEADKEESE